MYKLFKLSLMKKFVLVAAHVNGFARSIARRNEENRFVGSRDGLWIRKSEKNHPPEGQQPFLNGSLSEPEDMCAVVFSAKDVLNIG